MSKFSEDLFFWLFITPFGWIYIVIGILLLLFGAAIMFPILQANKTHSQKLMWAIILTAFAAVIILKIFLLK